MVGPSWKGVLVPRLSAVAAVICAGVLACAPAAFAAAAGAANAAEPLSVSADRGGAPTVEPGVHLIDLQTDGWLQVDRASAESTLWVGESITVSDVDSAEHVLSLHDEMTDCSWDGPDAVGGDLVQLQLRTGGVLGQECAGEAVWIHHDLYSAANYAGSPTLLAVWEEPPVDESKTLPKASRQVAWSNPSGAQTRPETLGSSYAAAPVLEDGRFEVWVEPGKPALFAVDLDWGQHLQVEMEVGEDNVCDAPQVKPRLINPLGLTAQWAEATASPSGTHPPGDRLVLSPNYASRAGAVSPTVRWRNRDAGNAAAVPGRYYVALDMEKEREDADAEGAELALDVVVVTDEEPVSPYAEEPAPMPDIATDLTSDTATTAADGADGESTQGAAADDKPWPAAIGLLAGSLVCAVLGVVLFGRWRRGVEA